jgi:dihydroorotate dehydrogenase
MTRDLSALAFPLLRRLDPERAHNLALLALRAGFTPRQLDLDPPELGIAALGQRFRNPIGLAAGFDKNAVAVGPLLRLGFGFVEAGTVTPQAQAGNPRPRLFRLPEHRGIINRMGMNGQGLAPFVARLQARDCRRAGLGANVGLNKEGADPERDYPALVAAVAPFADYIALNVSSPNTPGLRDLQGEARLRSILQAIHLAVPRRPPLLVKIAPDLADLALRGLVETCVANGVQGLIISNTTISRPAGLGEMARREAGGLSGRPLFALSTRILQQVRAISGGRLTLIGCGGIATGRDILTKLRAGASLVQLYSEFAYVGPPLIPRLKAELLVALREDGFGSVAEAVGADVEVAEPVA